MNIQQSIDACIKEAYALRSPETARTYRAALKLFSKIIDTSRPIEALSIDDFKKSIQQISGMEYGYSTLKTYVYAIKYYFEYAVLLEYLRPDYYQSMMFNKLCKRIIRKRRDHTVLYPEQGAALKILEAVKNNDEPSPRKERDKALIFFLYSTGCRVNEIASLKLDDLDFDKRGCKVVGKGDKERHVFFSKRSTQYLMEYIWAFPRYDYEPLFCRHDKGAGKILKPITTTSVRNIVRKYRREAGVKKFTPHSFRHDFAIRMLDSSKSIAIVQDLMGHANPSATRHYAKIYPERLKKAHDDAHA